MAESQDFPAWAEKVRYQTEQAMDNLLPECSGPCASLVQAMRYASLGGGKRFRALLVHAAGALSGAQAQVLARASAAMEFMHAYSLVHDDLPCMDNDDLRRGQPTVHVRFGQATALLAGDALQTLAFEVMASCAEHAATNLALVRELATAAGWKGMAGGQAIDLDAVGKSLDRIELEQMHRMKTGALIAASLRIGALCGGHPERDVLAILDRYADQVGLAFQVMDDVLDVVSESSVLGKTAGKDAAAGKPTYVSLLGLAPARDYACSLASQAVGALEPLGSRACYLVALANQVVRRVS